MNIASNKRIALGLSLAFSIITSQSYGQNNGMSIGKGGEAPNKHAIFEAVASDKGVLIPRMSGVQRNNITPDISANGLLVYDTDLNGFMYFDGTEWLPVTPDPIWQELALEGYKLSITPGNSVILPKQVLSYDPLTYSLIFDGKSISLANLATGPSGDFDPSNELQTLSIKGDSIFISSGNGIKLPASLTGSDAQKISFSDVTNILSLENGGTADLSKFATDIDPANELQSLSILGNFISISDGNSIELPSGITGADDQKVSFDDATNVLTLEDGGTADLSKFAADIDPANELQSLSILGNFISISDGNSIELPSGITGADDQKVSFDDATNVLTLEDGGTADLSKFTTDIDPANELQSLSILGNFISISDGNSIELPSGITGADDQKVSFDDATNVLTLEDGGTADLSKFATDIDPANELQSLSILGNFISISDGNSIELPSGITGADDQKVSFDDATNVLTLEDGGTADLSKFATDIDPANELQSLNILGNFISISDGNSIELPSGITGADDQKVSFDDATNVLTLEDGGTADLSKFATDIDPANELQSLSILGNTISISDGNSIVIPAGSDDQSLSIDNATNILSLEDGGSVDLSKYLVDLDADASNELQTISYANDSLELSLGGGKVKLVQTETDPTWVSVKNNYYTKTELQTTGDAIISWENITNVPASIDLDATDDFSGDYADLTNTPTATLSDNAVPRWDAATSTFTDGLIVDNNSNVSIGGPVNTSYLLFVNGKFGSAGINELSDARFKTNVTSFTPKLDKVCQMRAVTYSWDTISFPERHFSKDQEIGFIAQEVEALFPQFNPVGGSHAL